ncbi:unnamed protein product [Musa banksii]
MPPQKIEIFKSLEDWPKDNLWVHPRPVEKCWQPQDFLPDSSSEGFYEEVMDLREWSKELPDDFFLCLVGDMITEENVPTYQTIINTNDSVRVLFLCSVVISSGFEGVLHLQDSRTENNPYLGFIYTTFQERCTFISHGNTARLAKDHGELNLAQICGTIASDEKLHETAYTKVVEKLFEVDPDYTVLAFADMMRKKITMPAHLMYDGRDDNLF